MRADRKTLELVDRLQAEGRCTVRHAAALAEPEPPPVDDGVSEKAFMAEVVALARRHGWLVFHTTDSRKSQAGFPDLVLLRGNRLIVAELKTATGKLGADQKTWIEAFAAAGAMACVWRPGDWSAIAALLAA